MKKFKITYWNNGDILVTEIKAEDKTQAKRIFYMTVAHDDIKSIEEVVE